MNKNIIDKADVMIDIFEDTPKVGIHDIMIGKLVADLGMTGSGKSNTAARITEQLLDQNVGMSLLDIEGEYWGLKERYEVLVVGNSQHSDIKIDEDMFEKIASSLAEKVLIENIPLIIDLSGWSHEKWELGLVEYFTSLFQTAQKVRKPHLIVIEEAQEFIPQGIGSNLKNILIKIAKRGRKRGLSTLLASQRSADVDKKILSQCEVLYLHRVSHPTDLKVYYDLLSLERKKIKSNAIGFENGQCYLKLRTGTTIVKIKKRVTFHDAYTPMVGQEIITPQLKKIKKDLINVFKQMTKNKRKEKDLLERKETEIKRLNNLITVYEKTILNLEQQLQIASRIKVEVQIPKVIQNMVVKQLTTKDGMLVSNNNNRINNSLEGEIHETDIELTEPIKREIKSIKRSLEHAYEGEFIIMNFLIENHPDTFNTSRLASRLGYSNSQLYRANPKMMIEMGMIRKSPASPKNEAVWESYLIYWVAERFGHYENEEYTPLSHIINHFQRWIAKKAHLGDIRHV